MKLDIDYRPLLCSIAHLSCNQTKLNTSHQENLNIQKSQLSRQPDRKSKLFSATKHPFFIQKSTSVFVLLAPRNIRRALKSEHRLQQEHNGNSLLTKWSSKCPAKTENWRAAELKKQEKTKNLPQNPSTSLTAINNN